VYPTKPNNVEYKPNEDNQMSTELKIKFKSLSEEARIIKKEEKRLKAEGKTGHNSEYDSVYRHRIDVVRPIARATHLARAYIKGMPYAVVERKTHNNEVMYLTKKIFEMVKKYGGEKHHNVTIEAIENWYLGMSTG
jgi:hypothetical protein